MSRVEQINEQRECLLNLKNEKLINEVRTNLLILTTMYLTTKANEADIYIDNISDCAVIRTEVMANDLSEISINENGLVETEDIYELADKLANKIYKKLK